MPVKAEVKNREKLETKFVSAVQVVLLRNGENGLEFFLGKRTQGAFLGQWSFPGGAIDPGETARDAAIREAREETGVELKLGDLDLFDHKTATTLREIGGRRIKHIYDFDIFLVFAQDLNPINNSPREHEEMRWMSLAQAQEMHNAALRDARRNGITPHEASGIIAKKTLETMQALSIAA